MPVPDYVLNDEVRNMTVDPEAMIFRFTDGSTEPVVTTSELLPAHQELLDQFHDWLYS